jgi:hypothetical protein
MAFGHTTLWASLLAVDGEYKGQHPAGTATSTHVSPEYPVREKNPMSGTSIHELLPTDAQASAALNGRYTIQQVSSGRFLDAHEHAGEDFRLATRPAQNNDTQRWIIRPA